MPIKYRFSAEETKYRQAKTFDLFIARCGNQYNNVYEINCSRCKLKEINIKLPTNLKIFKCSENYLTSLPELNPYLEELYCDDNMIHEYPIFPETLRVLVTYDKDKGPTTNCHVVRKSKNFSNFQNLPNALEVLKINAGVYHNELETNDNSYEDNISRVNDIISRVNDIISNLSSTKLTTLHIINNQDASRQDIGQEKLYKFIPSNIKLPNTIEDLIICVPYSNQYSSQLSESSILSNIPITIKKLIFNISIENNITCLHKSLEDLSLFNQLEYLEVSTCMLNTKKENIYKYDKPNNGPNLNILPLKLPPNLKELKLYNCRNLYLKNNEINERLECLQNLENLYIENCIFLEWIDDIILPSNLKSFSFINNYIKFADKYRKKYGQNVNYISTKLNEQLEYLKFSSSTMMISEYISCTYLTIDKYNDNLKQLHLSDLKPKINMQKTDCQKFKLNLPPKLEILNLTYSRYTNLEYTELSDFPQTLKKLIIEGIDKLKTIPDLSNTYCENILIKNISSLKPITILEGGFPETLKTLKINGTSLKIFDKNIPSSLEILDLNVNPLMHDFNPTITDIYNNELKELKLYNRKIKELPMNVINMVKLKKENNPKFKFRSHVNV
jgi:hypothetical protein